MHFWCRLEGLTNMSVLRHSITRMLLSLAAGVYVCSAQIPSVFSNDGAAKATQVSGQVSVIKQSVPWAIQNGTQIEVNQVIVKALKL